MLSICVYSWITLLLFVSDDRLLSFMLVITNMPCLIMVCSYSLLFSVLLRGTAS